MLADVKLELQALAGGCVVTVWWQCGGSILAAPRMIGQGITLNKATIT